MPSRGCVKTPVVVEHLDSDTEMLALHGKQHCGSRVHGVYDRVVPRAPTVLVLGLVFLSLASCGDDGGGSASNEQSVELAKGPPRSAALAIRNCLNALGYEGRSGPVPASDKDAPDAVVFFQRGSEKGAAGEIGIYATDAEASDKLAHIEADAKSSGVVVASHGLATVIYFTNPADTTREDIHRCLTEANAA
jgi:hypothetical protein